MQDRFDNLFLIKNDIARGWSMNHFCLPEVGKGNNILISLSFNYCCRDNVEFMANIFNQQFNCSNWKNRVGVLSKHLIAKPMFNVSGKQTVLCCPSETMQRKLQFGERCLPGGLLEGNHRVSEVV